jgi:hypothetical protein
MSKETITITNYAADRFARLESTLSSEIHLALTGYAGEAKKDGADITYSYNPLTLTLTINVLHGPHLHNFDAFCTEIKGIIEAQQ